MSKHSRHPHHHRLKEQQLARIKAPALAKVIDRNLDVMEKNRHEAEHSRSFQERFADWITRFAGSVYFIYFHVLWFTAWIVVNLKVFHLPAFDPYPFGLLTTIVSLEAIFLSTFVLVSQNRQAVVSDRRADLDLQINLLSEYEITRILNLVDRIADQLGVDEGGDPELSELESDTQPEKVLKDIEQREKTQH